MRLLLDTHVFIWLLQQPHLLPPALLATMRDRSTALLVSAVTSWEISTKYRIGKLPQAEDVVLDYARHIRQLDATELPMTSQHGILAGSLVGSHRDPFDRILVAQAILEGVPLVTNDPQLRQFGAQIMW